MTADHPSAPPGEPPGAASAPQPAATPAHSSGATSDQPEHQESVLLDEPSTADLRAKVTQAWQEFARALAELLPELPAGAHVELTLDPTASGTGDAVYSIGIDVGEEGRLSARAVGNAALPDGYRLDRAAVADMIALGWSPPGVLEGSAGYFGLDATTTQPGRVAALLSRTLRDVYGAPHPAFLVYLIHDAEGEPLPEVPLGTARSEFGPGRVVEEDLDEALVEAVAAQNEENDVLALEERVRTVVSTMLKSDSERLQVDSDGDINIRAGSAMVFVRVRDNPPLVDVFSPVLTEVEPTERLYVKLSELTNRMPIGRLYCTDDTVWASIPVFGRNFQPTHLMLAVQVMTGLADELDDRLHGEFGGKRFFGDGDKAPRRADGEHRTGMYL